MIRQLIREMLLTEKVYGPQAVVYHGSRSPVVFVPALLNDTFNPGEGAGVMYGKGLYTVYDIKTKLDEFQNKPKDEACSKCRGTGLVSYGEGIRGTKHCDCRKRKVGLIDEINFIRYNDPHNQHLTTEDRDGNKISPTCAHCGRVEKLCSGVTRYADPRLRNQLLVT